MKNFDTRTYNVLDFVEWNNNGLLELSPDFQRRAVWTEKAKSYLIDTIIRGKPIPKILITQDLQGARNIRIVIDGQQRLRTILEFYSGDFKISNVHNKEFGGKAYDQLPEEVQNDFKKYELGVDILFETSYEEILDIFARINSYTVTLNKQEIYNAKYVGYFKNYVFKYGFKYVRYFVDARIITKAKVTRMGEAELTADLFVALIDSVQTNKGIENYYKKFEEEEGPLENAAEQFDKIMSYIGAIYPASDLSQTNWRRPQLFYTLFTSIGHLLYGLNGLNEDFRFRITEKMIGKLRVNLDQISARYDEISEDMENENFPKDYKTFINYSRRGTTDTAARISRANFVCEKLKKALA